MIRVSSPDERPESTALIGLIEDSLRNGAAQGKYKSTGIVYDVTTLPPGAREKSDAIAVRLDHESGYSVVVMIPYRLDPNRALVKGTIFATQGDGLIFRR